MPFRTLAIIIERQNKLNFSDQCQTKFLLPKSQNEFYDLLHSRTSGESNHHRQSVSVCSAGLGRLSSWTNGLREDGPKPARCKRHSVSGAANSAACRISEQIYLASCSAGRTMGPRPHHLLHSEGLKGVPLRGSRLQRA